MTTQIYTLTDPNTNKIRYVGKSNNPTKRFYKHYKYCEHKTHKNNWINKLISEGKKPILEIIDIVPINEWVFWEMYWIEQMKVWGFDLVNGTIGGDGSTFGSSTSFKKGQEAWNKGLEPSDETKEKLRQANLGKIASQDTKDKMSSSQKKVVRTEFSVLIEKGKKTRFDKNKSPWNKGLKDKKRKRNIVEQLDLNNNVIAEFNSYTEAATMTNCSAEVIRRCCIGKSKTSGGFKWRNKINENE
jgi:group I intron endonuclease